ncbi:MAG: nucleoside triphosphate pyrophosphatase [Acidimicrobiia bacterium]
MLSARLPRIVLASGSPRRRELLTQLGVTFDVRPADIDEAPFPGEGAAGYVERLATEKAATVVNPGELVIAADTTVAIDRVLLGKPEDDDDARRMLRLLAGRRHKVTTGVAVLLDENLVVANVQTTVSMSLMTDAEIDWYISTGEPLDKAGAYAVQGIGGAFVERIDGSVSNVVGLPMQTLLRLTRQLGIDLLRR